jgi:hypothetical protein
MNSLIGLIFRLSGLIFHLSGLILAYETYCRLMRDVADTSDPVPFCWYP